MKHCKWHRKYQWKKVETANFTGCRNNNADEKHSNSKVGNYKEKEWTNKQLAKYKHTQKCFVCGSENY